MSYHFFQRSARTSGGDDDLYDEDGSPILPHEFVKHDRGGKREMDIKDRTLFFAKVGKCIVLYISLDRREKAGR